MSRAEPVLWVPARTAAEHLALLPEGVAVAELPAAGPLDGPLGAGDILVAPLSPELSAAVIPRIEGLHAVQALTAGVDWLLELVPEGVTLCDAAGVHDVSVAEWCIAAILAMRRNLHRYRDQQRRGTWRWTAGVAGEELAGSTVLILGHGSIGRALEARLVPFDVEVLRVARTARPGVAAVEDLPGLLPRADVVVVLLPLTAATRGLVDAAMLARMRQGALLVNAARGAVVDTEALTEAVRRGRLRAALDVVEPEPLPADHPLWGLEEALVTPHVAGVVPAFLGRAWRLVAEQVRRYQAGAPLHNVVSAGY